MVRYIALFHIWYIALFHIWYDILHSSIYGILHSSIYGTIYYTLVISNFVQSDSLIRKLPLYLIPHCRVDTTFYRAGVYGLLGDDRLWITHEFVVLPDHVNIRGNYEPTVHGGVPTSGDPHL